jgi:hypothetical protein
MERDGLVRRDDAVACDRLSDVRPMLGQAVQPAPVFDDPRREIAGLTMALDML